MKNDIHDIHYKLGLRRYEVALMLPPVLAAELRKYTGHGDIQDALDIQAGLRAEASRWVGECYGLPLVFYILDGRVIAERLDTLERPGLGWIGQPLDNVLRAGFVREG